MSPSAFTKAGRERMGAMLPRMMEAVGVTEELKARAEEIIQDELIYN